MLGRYICNGLDEAMNSTPQGGNSRPEARDFDIIVIGGGTFGSAIAQQLFSNDCRGDHRILVLEGGPFFVPEHDQNMPVGIGHPNDKVGGQARTIANMRAQGHPDGQPYGEVWGLPWHSPIGFTGLSYSIGGRSVHWGGWSPRLLDAEMPTSDAGKPHRWPVDVVHDLKDQYFDEAAEQIGVDITNDFIHGPLHEAMRQRLADRLSEIRHAIPLSELPTTLKGISAADEDIMKLEAPLAVQSRPPRPGFFPINKFSAVPLITKAVRADVRQASQGGGGPDNVKRRLMIVPKCHVKRLGHNAGRVTEVFTNLRDEPIRFPQDGRVIIALGTIECIRLALLSFEGIPDYANIGQNLMAHLRSNLQFRMPREALEPLVSSTLKELQSSALFVKGRATRADGTVIGHFHQQITASGLGFVDINSEAELFKTVPDLDDLEHFKTADDGSVVITVRGIGEMVPQNPNSFVRFDNEEDEFGERRAFVSIEKDLASVDNDLHAAMDENAQDIVSVFANGHPVEPPPGPSNPSPIGGAFRHDGLGSTHHECGGVEMGDDPSTSVTNSDARFWHVENAYVAGPALFPTIGSPNPMLTGIAMSRRLADHLIPQPPKPVVEPGFTSIFDGLTANRWRISKIQNQPGKDDPGAGRVSCGALEMTFGTDLGLLWYTKPMPADFVLKLEWKRFRHEDNSGVFVRFPHPDSKGYDNTAWVGVHFGFEVQIDELGAPDGLPIHSTGAIYNEPWQTLTQQPALPAGEWNEFEIQVQGQTYTVFLNGTQVTTFTNTDPTRGLPSTADDPSFIGLQTHPGSQMAYRNIRFKKL